MSRSTAEHPLIAQPDPLQVAAAWPADRPLLMLHSGRFHPRWAGRSILASPAAWYVFDGRSHWVETSKRQSVKTSRLIHVKSPRDQLSISQTPSFNFSNDPLKDIDHLLAGTRSLPGCWIGYFSYDLGRVIEPAARHPHVVPRDDRNWPLIALAWCPEPMVFESIGDDAAKWGDDVDVLTFGRFDVSPLASATPQDKHTAAVQRTLEYIAAGDIFQANITQRLSASIDGSPRALMHRAMALSGAYYGAYLELPDRCIISMSPELFLHVDGDTRTVTTRPIKGTAPGSASAEALLRSEKDAAELHMIVDLMRNDLGRVCEFGSVRVPCPRTIESHPTVHHGVAEITGTLRPDVSFGDLLRATFPAGSVTGAPKIRAMQIIDELEPVQRGPYCGAIGVIGSDGSATLSVAIRTIALTGAWNGDGYEQFTGTLDYGAGGGIVADSDPVAEYRECMDKAAVLRAALQTSNRRNVETSK